MSRLCVLGFSRTPRGRVQRLIGLVLFVEEQCSARERNSQTHRSNNTVRRSNNKLHRHQRARTGAAPEQAPAAAPAAEQTQLPAIVVNAPKPKSKPKPKPGAAAPQRSAQQQAAAPQRTAQQVDAPTAAQAALNAKMQSMDQARENLLPKIGATTYTISRQAIVDMPQGDNTPIDKLILQMPGVSYNSAVSNPNFHVRNEYANVQWRINGVVIPEGVSALGPLFDTNFIASMTLLTGTLPAQYGLRTAGVLDIISRSYAVPGGEVSLYGGSRQTFTPSFDYGGSVGNTEYFVTARAIGTLLGLKIRRPTSMLSTITLSRVSSSVIRRPCSMNRHGSA